MPEAIAPVPAPRRPCFNTFLVLSSWPYAGAATAATHMIVTIINDIYFFVSIEFLLFKLIIPHYI
jgi:hypothetical protein